jgi:signal transduction histidine kinase
MNEDNKKRKIKYDLLILIPGLAFLISLIILYFVLTIPAGWESRTPDEHHQAFAARDRKDTLDRTDIQNRKDIRDNADNQGWPSAQESPADDISTNERNMTSESDSQDYDLHFADSGAGSGAGLRRGRGRGSGQGPWWRNTAGDSGKAQVQHRQIRRKVFTSVLVVLNILFLATLVFAMKFRDKVIKKDQQISNFDRLTRSFSHEVLNPLNAISLCSQAIERDLNKHREKISSYPGIENKFSIIQGEIQRLTSIVRGFRSLSGNIIPEITDVQVTSVLEECRALFNDQAQVAGIAIYVRSDDNVIIKADRNLLKQVLINFIKNSIEAIRETEDRINPQIVLTAKACDEKSEVFPASENENYNALIMVEDSGPGIKAKKIDRIFEYTYTDKPDGLGIGLAISKKIIQAHNWKVKAENIDNSDKGIRGMEEQNKGARMMILV